MSTVFKSHTIGIYGRKLAGLTPEQIAFVDSVYAVCEKNYAAGGDVIVECYSPAAILESFQTLADVQEMAMMRNEQAANCRWGEDTDPELRRPDWK